MVCRHLCFPSVVQAVKLFAGASDLILSMGDVLSDTSFSYLAQLALKKTGKWAATVAFLGGATSDILNPLGPFAGYIAVISAFVAVVIVLALLFRIQSLQVGVPALVFAVICSVVAGGIYSLQQTQDAENGIIAKLVPAVETLQQSLGLISAKVDKIAKTVDENLAVTKNVQETTEIVQKQTAEIALAIDEIAAGFKTLGAQGGVIANPERPDQFYHNARIQELGGDILNARQSYLGFARFNVDAVDPYARFATLLKVSEGRAGAREVLGALRETNKTKALELAWIQLLEESQRTAKIQEFAKSNPTFGPALFLLAEEFSEDRLGQRSLSDKREEMAALNPFLASETDGGLNKYFVDLSVLANWTSTAQSRLAALGNLDVNATPTINPVRSGQGWQVSIAVPEPVKSIFWRIGADGAFADTGKLAFNDQQTGQPMANPSFQLAADAPSGPVFIKYIDLRGHQVGPFEIKFDPADALIASQKAMIEQTWTGWIAFDASGFRGNVYYTSLAVFSCGFKEVRYGLNGGPLDKLLVMPPCNPDQPFAIPDGFVPYFKVTDDIKSMSVEVVYKDDTTSGIKQYKRP